MKKPKLTPTERRARAFCEAIRAGNVRHFTVEWIKSKTWGLCPRIRWQGDKVAHASGCGYDKHSTVLALALHWLPEDPEHQHTIACAAGSGVSSIRDILAGYGWTLETQEGRAEDFHTIRPR
jgi:predicted dehydrogenase